MKVVTKPIVMTAKFDKEGKPHPSKFIVEIDDVKNEIRIDKIIKRDLVKHTGKQIMIFTCESTLRGQARLYEIRYELISCKWTLFKI